MEFSLGYSIGRFTGSANGSFAGLGFNMYQGKDYSTPARDTTPFFASFDANVGTFLDIKIHTLPRGRRLPKHFETTHLFLRTKFTYQLPIAGRDGNISGDLFYISVQVGMLFLDYELKQ